MHEYTHLNNPHVMEPEPATGTDSEPDESIHILTPLLLHPLILFTPRHPICPTSGFQTKILYAFLVSTIRGTCHAHTLLHDMITPIIFCEEYKLWSSSLCYFIQYQLLAL